MQLTDFIYASELKAIAKSYGGSILFEQALERSARADDLVRLLVNYTKFNEPAGAGVLNLAGAVAARTDLFRDPRAPEIIADRSYEIAQDFHFAVATGEIGEPSLDYKTHRRLTQDFIEVLSEYFGYDITTLHQTMRPYQQTFAAADKIKEGYGINQFIYDEKLFRMIGFHNGSEPLADDEFRILYGFLNLRERDFMKYLHDRKADFWIRFHILEKGENHLSESEHAEKAVIGANKAINFYAGAHSHSYLKDLVIDGYKNFCEVQKGFMESLVK